MGVIKVIRYIKKKLFVPILIFLAITGMFGSDLVAEGTKSLKAESSTVKEESTWEKKKCDRAMVKVTLNRVVDGDTLEVIKTDGTISKVRLIGIDTPESVSSNQEKNSKYGKIASDYTKKLLPKGTVLYLEYTDKKIDQYGRDLAYVWTKNIKSKTDKKMKKYCINAKLVVKGYARPYFEQDNQFYRENFQKFFKLAKKQKRGLFQYGSELTIWK